MTKYKFSNKLMFLLLVIAGRGALTQEKYDTSAIPAVDRKVKSGFSAFHQRLDHSSLVMRDPALCRELLALATARRGCSARSKL